MVPRADLHTAARRKRANKKSKFGPIPEVGENDTVCRLEGMAPSRTLYYASVLYTTDVTPSGQSRIPGFPSARHEKHPATAMLPSRIYFALYNTRADLSHLRSASRYAMSNSIMALSVFHLSERTVINPYLICFGETLTATVDLPAEKINGRSKKVKEEQKKTRMYTIYLHRSFGAASRLDTSKATSVKNAYTYHAFYMQLKQTS